MQIVKGYNLDHCNEAYEENHIKIIRSQLCAAGDHGEDTCSGGGGGSLVGEHSINQTTYRYLAGIVSFGNRVCSLPNSPGIFTVNSHLFIFLNSNRINYFLSFFTAC